MVNLSLLLIFSASWALLPLLIHIGNWLEVILSSLGSMWVMHPGIQLNSSLVSLMWLILFLHFFIKPLWQFCTADHMLHRVLIISYNNTSSTEMQNSLFIQQLLLHSFLLYISSHYNFPSQPQSDYWILYPFILSQPISAILDVLSSLLREKHSSLDNKQDSVSKQ